MIAKYAFCVLLGFALAYVFSAMMTRVVIGEIKKMAIEYNWRNRELGTRCYVRDGRFYIEYKVVGSDKPKTIGIDLTQNIAFLLYKRMRNKPNSSLITLMLGLTATDERVW